MSLRERLQRARQEEREETLGRIGAVGDSRPMGRTRPRPDERHLRAQQERAPERLSVQPEPQEPQGKQEERELRILKPVENLSLILISMPSIIGMFMSIKTISGFSLFARVTASRPLAASPITEKSPSNDRSFLRFSRVSAISSAIRILMGDVFTFFTSQARRFQIPPGDHSPISALWLHSHQFSRLSELLR